MGDAIIDHVVETPKGKVWTKKNAFLLISIAYANFTLGTCYSLPAPFFPKEAEMKGATPTVYGFVFGVFQLVNLVMSPIWGKMMPYLVPRFVLVAGMFVAGSSSVLFGVLEFCPPGTPYIVLSFFVRIVESVGVTAYITTCYGLLPVYFPDNVGAVLSTMETLFGFGMIAGPTVGGALYQIGGYYLPFIVMGGCLIFGTVLTSIAFSGKDDPSQPKSGSVFNMLSSGSLILNLLVFSSAAVCIGFNDSTLEPHLRQFNLKPAVLGTVFIIVGGIYALVSPLFGLLIDKGVNTHILCILGLSLCFVAFLLIGPVPFLPFKTSLPVIIVSLVLQGLGMGAMSISAFMGGMKDILRRGFPDSVTTYALYTGICMSFSSFGAFIGPSLGGFFLDHIGYENGTIFVVALQLCLIIVIAVYVIRSITRKTESPSAHPEDPEINTQQEERAPLLASSNSVET